MSCHRTCFVYRPSLYFASPKKYNGEILINFEPQQQSKRALQKTCSDGEIIRRKNVEREDREATVSDCEICYQSVSDDEEENEDDDDDDDDADDGGGDGDGDGDDDGEDEEHSDKSSHTSTKPSSNKQLVSDRIYLSINNKS